MQEARFEDLSQSRFKRGLRRISWFLADHYGKILVGLIVLAAIYFFAPMKSIFFEGNDKKENIVVVKDTTATADSAATAKEMPVAVSIDTLAMKARWEADRARNDSIAKASVVVDSVIGPLQWVSASGETWVAEGRTMVYANGAMVTDTLHWKKK